MIHLTRSSTATIQKDSTMTNRFSKRRSRRRQRFGLLAVVMALTISTTLPRRGYCFVSAVPNSQHGSSSKKKAPILRTTRLASTVGLSAADATTASTTSTTTSKRNNTDNDNHNNSNWRMAMQRRLGLLSQKQEADFDYQKRKEEWASRYTQLDSLRATFGSNRNKVWGDLNASTARRLYKTLLPRALLELYDLGCRSEDLAPLAYQARVAAKLYARERCQVPSRYAAMAIDGFRALKRYGKFQPKGMSYDQVWSKYESQILEELSGDHDLTEEDVTAKICLKILERSCQTNAQIDKWIIQDQHLQREQHLDLVAISKQLERDVRELLNEEHPSTRTISARRVFTLRLVARAKRRLLRQQQKQEQQQQDKNSVASSSESASTEDEQDVPQEEEQTGKDATASISMNKNIKQAQHPWDNRTHKINNRRKAWQERSRPSRTK